MKPVNNQRRNFLKAAGALGAAGSVGALSGCLPKEDPFALSQEKPPVPGSDSWYRGEEKTLVSACGQCPVNCGIHVRVVEGRAVKINGNPASMQVGGKLGPKGQTGLFTLYDPDRIQTPLKRMGKRGEGQWQKIPWEEALNEVSKRLGNMRSAGDSHKLAVFCGRPRGFMRELLARFCSAYGTPNFFDPLPGGDGALVQAMELMTGVPELPGYDAENTAFILSLGSAIFESTCNGIHFARGLGSYRHRHTTQRSRIVHVDTHYSATAKVADQWVPLAKAGTYDALALGIAHVLIANDWHDKDFISAHTSGFERFQAVLQDYDPESVSKRTGISEAQIKALAEQLHVSSPAIAVVDERSLGSSNALEIARAVLALNAVLGNWEKAGGLVVRRSPPLADWEALVPDSIAQAGMAKPSLDGHGATRFPFAQSAIDVFPEAVMGGMPYAPEALLLYYSNPLYSRNQPDRFRKALDKIPFVASFSPFMDESAYMSDIILPDHTFLERWEEALPPPLGFRSSLGMRRPVVDPLYQTRHTGDVLLDLARSLGGTVAQAFPWGDFKEAMEQRLVGIGRAQRGSIVVKNEDAFAKKLGKVGYWNDDPVVFEESQSAFATPSGKFEFHATTAEAKIKSAAAVVNQPPEDYLHSLCKESIEDACLPHAESPKIDGDPKEYPLLFTAYKDITYAEGSGANIPMLVQLAGLQKGLDATESWHSWAEVNGSTAAKLGLKRGDAVSLESPAGKITAQVLIRDGVADDAVMMALGKGHTQMGRFAKDKGSNAKHLLPAVSDPLSGISYTRLTRVRIAKV